MGRLEVLQLDSRGSNDIAAATLITDAVPITSTISSSAGNEDDIAGTAALQVGALSPDVVAVQTRRHQQRTQLAGEEQVVVSLPGRRLVQLSDQLPPDLRPLPTVTAYDSLLTGTRDA